MMYLASCGNLLMMSMIIAIVKEKAKQYNGDRHLAFSNQQNNLQPQKKANRISFLFRNELGIKGLFVSPENISPMSQPHRTSPNRPLRLSIGSSQSNQSIHHSYSFVTDASSPLNERGIRIPRVASVGSKFGFSRTGESLPGRTFGNRIGIHGVSSAASLAGMAPELPKEPVKEKAIWMVSEPHDSFERGLYYDLNLQDTTQQAILLDPNMDDFYVQVTKAYADHLYAWGMYEACAELLSMVIETTVPHEGLGNLD